MNTGGFFQSIHASGYYVYSGNGDRKNAPGNSGPTVPPYPVAVKPDTIVFGSGQGFYGNVGLDLKHNITIMGSFWMAENFSSPRGGQLYPSESSSYKKAGLIAKRRTLIILRLYHDWKVLENLTFSTRIEPYWDLDHELFEFTFGFYLNYRPEFFIWKNK
jgi:hypothetical protein